MIFSYALRATVFRGRCSNAISGYVGDATKLSCNSLQWKQTTGVDPDNPSA